MFKIPIVLLSLFISILFFGCSAPLPTPVQIKKIAKKVNYLQDVKPILDKRCVVCHSCYNAPCQAKYSSFEGIDRGASKLKVYNPFRFKAMQPTRLFIDAKNTQEWHQKSFFSLTKNFDANTSYNDSIMIHMLHDKKLHPNIIGSYRPETDKLMCPKNLQEMGNYLEEKPNHGMPYGMPAVSDKEYDILTQWLAQGAKGPTPQEQKKLTTPSKAAQIEIKKWEKFLNSKDAKHIMSARYLFEHLYLAHWHFTNTENREFFRLVRSRTPAPQAIDEIASVRPFDNPNVDKFYYRLQKIHSTIVHKTHMLLEFNDTKLARFQELFIQTKWLEKPHVMSYNAKNNTNPFLVFSQIPPKSRYQFLLDNAKFIVMTFIRGPVCRGQIALNVIHDHFWIMFQDPNFDVSVLYPKFLLHQASNLAMPIQTTTEKLLAAFSDKYRIKSANFFKAKEALIRQVFPQGQGYEAIWKGHNKLDTPLLSIYRHFDSASVHKGVIGRLPRTLWMIDYPEFERIYYSLVAGYDVFGNLSHQTNIRRYMDLLRMEGELNFLSFMPKNRRLQMFKSWYLQDDDVQDLETLSISKNNQRIDYKTIYPKSEFIENLVKHHILKSTQINFDTLNYYNEYQLPPSMPSALQTADEIKQAAKSLTAPGTSFIRFVTDHDVNTLSVRIILKNKKSKVFTLVINRWHDNVNSIFREESTLNPGLDTLDFIEGSVGSYPNAFLVVKTQDLSDFFDILQNFNGDEYYKKRLQKYWIGRENKKFWETYDWFQNYFNQTAPIKSGLYDLNRYYHN